MQMPKSCIPMLVVVLFTCRSHAQTPLGYLDTSLPAQQRAQDLVHRMTVEEKVTQLVNQSRAIPRLKIPAYDWWSEALHGVAANGTTEFPEPIALAAAFDTEAIHRMAVVIGTEGRTKHMQAVREGHSDIFEGLDFWAPNINIFRDPRSNDPAQRRRSPARRPAG
jgi:beta-glucosidase